MEATSAIKNKIEQTLSLKKDTDKETSLKKNQIEELIFTDPDTAVEYLEKAVKMQIGSRKSKWSKNEWRDVKTIIKAAVYPILKEDAAPGEVKRLLSKVKSGYGCWLDSVETALKKAVREVPEAGREDFLQIFGGFKVAVSYLFDIEKTQGTQLNGHSNGNGNGHKAGSRIN